jgi:hypothetical protein
VTSRLPHFLDNRLTDGGEVSLTRWPPFTPGRFLVLISIRGWVDPKPIVWLEGLGRLKKIHLIGTRTRELPAGSIVPQPIMLPRAPIGKYVRAKTVTFKLYHAVKAYAGSGGKDLRILSLGTNWHWTSCFSHLHSRKETLENHWIDTRTDISVATMGKILPLPGIEPRSSNHGLSFSKNDFF